RRGSARFPDKCRRSRPCRRGAGLRRAVRYGSRSAANVIRSWHRWRHRPTIRRVAGSARHRRRWRMPEAILSVAGLRKFFTVRRGFPNPRKITVRAVDGISFEVAGGEAFGLVGESGCGKSTAGRAVLRLVEPDEGTVVFKGEDVRTASKA